MVYNRGTQDDFNRLANSLNDQTWSWNSLLPYMKKVITSRHFISTSFYMYYLVD